jgi:coproporphyrinogen III oxidase-like Fe-S oxidoreductase
LGGLGALIHSQNLSDPLEWSIEIAPSEISIEKLETLSKFGVNRISLGVQPFISTYEGIGKNARSRNCFASLLDD